MKDWDWQITRTLSEKIEDGNYIKKEAIRLCMGLRMPSEYYQETQLVQGMKKLNDNTDMGETTRTRMVWAENKKYKSENAAYTQMMRGRREGMRITANPEFAKPILQDTTTETKWMTITIGGRTRRIPQDHEGIWGNEEEVVQAKNFHRWFCTPEKKRKHSRMGRGDSERLDGKELEQNPREGT